MAQFVNSSMENCKEGRIVWITISHVIKTFYVFEIVLTTLNALSLISQHVQIILLISSCSWNCPSPICRSQKPASEVLTPVTDLSFFWQPTSIMSRLLIIISDSLFHLANIYTQSHYFYIILGMHKYSESLRELSNFTSEWSTRLIASYVLYKAVPITTVMATGPLEAAVVHAGSREKWLVGSVWEPPQADWALLRQPAWK